MVQIQVPPGAPPGAVVAYPMPSGCTVQVTIPMGAGEGTVLEVEDPGMMLPAAPAVAYGEVVGIEKGTFTSQINGMSPIGPQHAPPGFDLMGHKYGIVARTLAPGEVFWAEPGSMIFMSDSVKMSVKMGGFSKGFSSVASGEALVKVSFTNEGSQPAYLGLTSNQPFSMVVPLMMGALPGNTINVRRGSYMAGTSDIEAKMKFLPTRSLAACCCGGMAPIIQEVRGSPQGVAFLSAPGTVVTKSMAAGEKILIDSSSIVGFENTVQFDVRQVGTCLTCCCGGEGCFNTELTGPGNIYISSISVDRLMTQLVTVQQESSGGDGGGDGAAPKPENIAR